MGPIPGILADATGTVPARELLLCLNESVSNLRLAGMDCAVSLEGEGPMDGAAAGRLYDFFEAAVEEVWQRLPAMDVMVARTDPGWRMTLMLEWDGALPALCRQFSEAEVERDEELCYCRLTVGKGGAPV